MKKVLFFQQHPDEEAGSLELSLSHLLKAQGAQCLHVLCGSQNYRVCDRFPVGKNLGTRASACAGPCFEKHYQERKQLGLATATLRDMTAPSITGTANAWFFDSTAKDLKSEAFAGIPLYPLVLPSLARSLQAWESLDPNGADRFVCSEWMRYAIEYFGAALEACERFHPDLMIVGDGRLLSSRIGIAVAVQLEIPFLSLAHGPGESRFRVGVQRAALPVVLDNAHAGVARSLGADERKRLESMLAPRAPSNPSGSKKAVILAGTPWSLSAVRQKPTFSRQIDWIASVVEAAARHGGWKLVLEPHPEDPGWSGPARESILLEAKKRAFPESLFSIASKPSGRSWHDADLVLDYGTDAGLCAAASGIPVITLHETAWNSWGVGKSPNSQEQSTQTLSQMLRSPDMESSERDRALCAAHDYFFESVGLKDHPEDLARVAEIALDLSLPAVIS